MLNIILILISSVILLVVIVAALQPADFKISRSQQITAPASAIFPHVNNLSLWEAWSPWAKLDPHAKNTFEGPQAGVGATMRWSGNSKVGVGSMVIIESESDDFIKFKLEFIKPMMASNISVFSFASEDGQTTVTWQMMGSNRFMGKLMGLIMNCDKMVGGQFAQGLTALKHIVEQSS